MMKKLTLTILPITLLLLLSLGTSLVLAEELPTLRYGEPIDQEVSPSPIPKVIDKDIRSKRNYPMQPPLIPHDTRGYQVDLAVNKCMSCHARKRVEESQAPMISVTHYMDRDGNFLAEISPRRYFCNQCHVTQTDSRITVENEFEDMDELLRERAGADSGN
ncbi:MAG: nitrate reductase cytochrome c-type subunit; periplasmic nitrate reductase electron transfer subunit [Xanthomonadales bacterium]|nr:nitrate reductase cytochrome c-type subunit; periplasmic nitrate reductase electron transfer subunit [Xanthomonadales bacterium]